MKSYLSTRKEAMAANVGQYYTGKPCKNGHITYRYTTSGACAECVSVSAGVIRDAVRGVPTGVRERLAERRAAMSAAFKAERAAKTEAMRALVPIRIPIYPEDVDTIFETAIAICLEAYPMLERLDVLPSRTPIRTTPLYVINVPPAHVQLLRDIGNQLYGKHKRDFSYLHHRIVESVEKAADDEASPPPEGWR